MADEASSGPTRSFHIADYCVFAASLLLALGIGLYHACTGDRQRTKKDYLMGNRQLSLIPVSVSMLVSLISANTVLGVPADVYSVGITVWLVCISICISIFFTMFTTLPLLYPLPITSCYEYLQLRFGSPYPRQMASLLFLLRSLLFMGTVLYGPSTALESVTGFPTWASIVCVTTVATLYTTAGGMRAVIWTDVCQCVIMFIGLIAIIALGWVRIGSMTEIFNINMKDGRIDFSQFFIFPGSQRFTFWMILLGQVIHYFDEYAVYQPSTQRFCALPTLSKARLSLILNMPMNVILFTLCSLAGLVTYAYFAKQGCDPLQNGDISNANQALTLLTLEVLGYPGVPGVILAAIFSASLSTVSSSLNSMVACLWEDFMKKRFHLWSERRVVVSMKIMVFVFGAASMGCAFIVASIGGSMFVLSGLFMNLTVGPTVGLFLLGGFFRFTKGVGALVGALAGLAVPIWMMVGYTSMDLQHAALPGRTHNCLLNTTLANVTTLGNSSLALEDSVYGVATTLAEGIPSVLPKVNATDPRVFSLEWFYSFHYSWHPVISLLVTMVVGCVVSLLLRCKKCKDDQKEIDPRYLFPITKCCFSQKGKYDVKMQNGVDGEQMKDLMNGEEKHARELTVT